MSRLKYVPFFFLQIEPTGKNKTRDCDDSDASDSNLNPESYSEAF